MDAWGKTIVSQFYEHDELDNILTLTTHFIGGENITTFHYDYVDRTQLSSVTHSHPDYSPQRIQFEYDADGNQRTDELGRVLNYDELGCLYGKRSINPTWLKMGKAFSCEVEVRSSTAARLRNPLPMSPLANVQVRGAATHKVPGRWLWQSRPGCTVEHWPWRPWACR